MGFSIKTSRGKRTFTYTGDLRAAIEQARKELDGKRDSQERVFLLWQYEQAKKAHEKYEERIKNLEDFIYLAEKEIKKQEEGGKENESDTV